MSREHVGHGDIVRFADTRVNLKREDASELRAQANRLRDKLQAYLSDHPDFALKKMLLSGSLAKGTALKSVSDIDVACYVASDSAPHAVSELIEWLAKRLESAFPGFKPSQIVRKTYSVSVNFIATGNEVDIVPILYAGDPQWRGSLISQDTGEPLMTSVPMHLEFIRKRKAENPVHFAQMVRLIKFWAGLRKRENPEFRFKSFMIEMIVAHLADRRVALNDYPEALQSFFTFLAMDQLRSVISFTDYYPAGTCISTSDAVRIWDPVNCENNVSKLYTETNRNLIVEAAIDAGDAIDAALRAVSKGETVRYWQKVFGPSFDV
jgi:hypothetical protein